MRESGFIGHYYRSLFPGLTLEGGRSNYDVLCPFHPDTRPSCSVNIENGVYFCHACDVHGSVFEFRERFEKISRIEARARFAAELTEFLKTHPGQRPTRTDTPVRDRPLMPYTDADVDRWHAQLFEDSTFGDTLARLRAEGLRDETIRTNRLGGDVDVFSRGTLRGPSLVIPIVARGKLVTVKKFLYKDGEKYVRTYGKAKQLFNIDLLTGRTGGQLFITEGEKDSIRLTQEGVLAVSSCGGANSWDDSWAPMFKPFDVAVVLDSDPPGRRGAAKIVASLVGVASSIRNVDLFPGTTNPLEKDVTDFFRSGKSLRDFLELVDKTPVNAPTEPVPPETNLCDVIDDIVSEKGKRHRHNERIGEAIFKFIKNTGGVFFRDRTNNVYLMIRGHQMLVDFTDRPFESFLFSISRITTGDVKGKVIVKSLQALGLEDSQLVSEAAFSRLDPQNHTLWVNPSLESGELLCIRPEKIDVLPNGTNLEHIFLLRAGMMHPLRFMHLSDTDVKSGLLRIEELVLRHLACSPANRWLVLTWTLGFPLKDLVKMKPLLRLEGISGGGKSTAVELLTALVYGADKKLIASPAAQYSEGTTHPLLFLDNIERRNLGRQEYDFLLTSSTGISKLKRRQGTDTDVVTETPRCLVATTGIESMPGQEVITRSIVVEFDRTKYGSDLSEAVFHQIVAERSLLMSSLFHLHARILGRIAQGEWQKWTGFLRTEFPGQAKDRATGYLGLMLLLLDEWFTVTGKTNRAEEYARQWIDEQNTTAQSSSEDSNPIVEYLDMLVAKCRRRLGEEGAPWNYAMWKPTSIKTKGQPERIRFSCFARQLHLTLAELMKGMSPGYGFRDAKQLGCRLSDSMKTLEHAGWKVRKVCRKGGCTVWSFEYSIPNAWSGTKPDEDVVDHQ